MQYPEPIMRLIKAFAALPGVGEKTASRLALYVLNARKEYADELISSLTGVRDGVGLCTECMGFSENEICPVCSDPSRDGSAICVVGDYKDMVALEAAGSFKGKYHVLHGLLAPLKGIGPDDIRIRELIGRASSGGVKEVIDATAFDSEGEATAVYLKRALDGKGVRLTRLASGVPAGGSIEYMDPVTLGRAMEGRREA